MLCPVPVTAAVLQNTAVPVPGLFQVPALFCDVYEFVEGNPDYVPLFLGNYMSGYEWGQEVVPYLNNLYCQYCETPMNGLSDQVHETILSQRKKGGKRK